MKTQRHLVPSAGAARPSGEPVRPCGESAASSPHLVAAIEVVLDELDSLAHRADREGDRARVPEIALQLLSGETIRGIVLEYASWQQAVMVRTSSNEVVRVGLHSITSVSVNLVAGQSRRRTASGLVRIHR